MSRPSQDPLPPPPFRCMSCGSLHVFLADVDTLHGRSKRLKCVDCGWHASEASEPPKSEKPDSGPSAPIATPIAQSFAAAQINY